jgi:hypothetical protein
MHIRFSRVYYIIIINFTLIGCVAVRQLHFEIGRSHRKIVGSEFGRLEFG